jgi:predicted transposase YbfD/YdcC
MSNPTDATVLKHFSSLKDPRVERTRRHSLQDILVISLCGFICGVDDWVELEAFGKAKLPWFRTFLELPNGIPSHDTFGRVYRMLDPEGFGRCFTAWVAAIAEVTEGEVVAVDGKTVRRSLDKASGKAAIHMVNAWACGRGLALGQLKTEEKSNEITAVPRLLDCLALAGCIVTLDAMGCQKETVRTIVEKGADYVVSLKENQPLLHEDAKRLFEDLLKNKTSDDFFEDTDKGHGRVEVRRCWTSSKVNLLLGHKDWTGLTSVALIESERHIGEEVSTERRYILSSLPADDASHLLGTVRTHWAVETSLHWTLDMAFREDDSRVRKDFAPENLAMLRQVALNLLKQGQRIRYDDGKEKKTPGIKARRKMAGWDHDWLLHLLGFQTPRSPLT